MNKNPGLATYRNFGTRKAQVVCATALATVVTAPTVVAQQAGVLEEEVVVKLTESATQAGGL